MLITLLRETKYMEGKKEKEWYWEKIQAALNTIGPKKTIIQWKKVSADVVEVKVEDDCGMIFQLAISIRLSVIMYIKILKKVIKKI